MKISRKKETRCHHSYAFASYQHLSWRFEAVFIHLHFPQAIHNIGLARFDLSASSKCAPTLSWRLSSRMRKTLLFRILNFGKLREMIHYNG